MNYQYKQIIFTIKLRKYYFHTAYKLPNDVYKPERWVDDALFRPEVRSAFKILVKQGWTDAIRKLYPDEKIYTYWDYFRNAYGRDAGLRVDHFLLSPHLDKRLVNAGVARDLRGWEKTSDHAPAWIELADK